MSNRTIFAQGSINWDENAIRIMLSGPGGEVSADIQRRARAVQRRAQYLAPVRTGQLRSSIHVNTRHPSEGAVADITADAPYGLYVEFGRRESTPRDRKVLYWSGPPPVFALAAERVEEVPFMRNALDAFDD